MPSTALPSSRKTKTAAEVRSDSPWGLSDRLGCAVGAWGWPAAGRRAEGRSRLQRFAQSALILLVTIGVASSGAAAVHLRGRPTPVPAEFGLLADSSSSTLKDTSAETSPTVDAPQQALPTVDREVASPSPEPVVAPPVEDALRRPRPLPLPPEVETAALVPPAAPSSSTQPGDCTMMFPTKRYSALILAAAVATAPALGNQVEKPEGESDKNAAVLKQINDLKKALEKSLEALAKDVGDVKTNLDLIKEGARKDIDKLSKDVGAPVVTPVPNGKEIEDLKKRLDQIEVSLKAIREQLAATRVAAFPPAEGRIELTNDYPQAMEFVINGKSYTVRPGETREVKLPAGKFSFQIPAIPGYQTPQTRTLGTEKPHVLRIYPQQ
jgi:hypothetical protein